MEGKEFDHEQLIAYRTALEFVEAAHRTARTFPEKYAFLGDQLRRAATSIVLNTAEGAGEFARRDKKRFYRMALRSATECAGAIAIGRRLGFISIADEQATRSLLIRIISLLTGLVR
jgi:four helix bundle protein